MDRTVSSIAHRTAPVAQIWVDRRRAIVARPDRVGVKRVREFSIPDDEVARIGALAAVVHCVVDAPRVVVLGAPDMRTLLEREYVGVVHRPERIVDVA